MKLAKGEWAEQGWIWIAFTLVIAIVWGRDMPVAWALLLHSGPFLVGILLLLEVRWAPEFLVVVVATFITIILVKIFQDGFSLPEGLACYAWAPAPSTLFDSCAPAVHQKSRQIEPAVPAGFSAAPP